MSNCELCGEPMPTGEEMFKYHGLTGPCPVKPTEYDLLAIARSCVCEPLSRPSEEIERIGQYVLDAMPEINGLREEVKRLKFERDDLQSKEISWFDPKSNPPPFGEKLLMMVSGSNSYDCGRTFNPYSVILTGTIKESGPGDDYEETLTIDDWLSSDRTNFPDFQFHIEVDDTEEESDWCSDSIIAWANYPQNIEHAFTVKGIEKS